LTLGARKFTQQYTGEIVELTKRAEKKKKESGGRSSSKKESRRKHEKGYAGREARRRKE